MTSNEKKITMQLLKDYKIQYCISYNTNIKINLNNITWLDQSSINFYIKKCGGLLKNGPEMKISK